MKRIPGCIFTAEFKREAIDSDLQRTARMVKQLGLKIEI